MAGVPRRNQTAFVGFMCHSVELFHSTYSGGVSQMYSVVLMAAMIGGSESADFGRKGCSCACTCSYSCSGCACYSYHKGCFSCFGCHRGCFSCYSYRKGCFSCHKSCYSYSCVSYCHGCTSYVGCTGCTGCVSYVGCTGHSCISYYHGCTGYVSCVCTAPVVVPSCTSHNPPTVQPKEVTPPPAPESKSVEKKK